LKLFILIFILFTNSFANDNIWTKDTASMSESKSTKIINSYIENNNTNLTFIDSQEDEVITYPFRENILTIGLDLGYDYNSEKIYNTIGEKTDTFSSYSFKITFAKDFTLWHEEYTQPSRIYASYNIAYLDEDVSYSTFSIGLRENMFYWSIYQDSKLNIYPSVNFELGSSSISRETYTSSGFTSVIGAGITLVNDDNFEYFINFNSKSIDWDHPVDGIADEMSVYSISFGLNYKLMYGDI